MNLANKITLSRIPLTFLFMGAVLWDGLPWRYTISLGIFAVACLTDTIDGWVARRLNLVGSFGSYFDPITDKILVGGAFICLVGLGWFPAWAVVLLMAREFAVTGLRLVSADQKVVLSAERGGKLKTFVHSFAINYILARLALSEEFHVMRPLASIEVDVLVGICLLLSLVTGFSYFMRSAKLLNP